VKCVANPRISADDLGVHQWDAYQNEGSQVIDADAALNALHQWMLNNSLEKLTIKTRLLIAPPYQPKIAKGLITNFHQPASTLLLLVAAVTRNRWREIYDYALQHDFRFLSYGDGCLLFFD
jgi:S-adenosylmethionine:tRNA ribosyltransferase-isomerase